MIFFICSNNVSITLMNRIYKILYRSSWILFYYGVLVLFLAAFYMILLNKTDYSIKKEYYLFSFYDFKSSVITIIHLSLMDNFGLVLYSLKYGLLSYMLFVSSTFILSIITISLLTGVFYSNFKIDYEEILVNLSNKYNKIPTVVQQILKNKFIDNNQVKRLMRSLFY